MKQKSLFTELIEISSGGELLCFPYKEVLINGYELYEEKKLDNKRGVKQYKTREENKIVKAIYFLEGLPNEESYITNGFIDLEIEVNGEKFVRSCENFFILKGMKDELLKEFFNSIASRYESLIDKDLNKKIIKIMFEEIGKVIEKRKIKNTKILDYGVGTGISFEVLKFYEEIDNEIRLLDKKILEAGYQKKFQAEINKNKTKPQSEKIFEDINKQIKDLQRKVKKRRQGLNKISLIIEKGDLTGCDLSERMLDRCKHKGFFYVSEAEYDRTGYESDSFDAIMSVFVVHYFYNEKPYKEINRILKPGGLFIFNTKPYELSNGSFKHKRGKDEVWSKLSSIFGNIKRYEAKIKTSEKTRIIPIYICKKNS